MGRDAKDLQETREQITSCFDTISCYGMSHPGFAVTKKKYSGSVDQLETQFLHLIDRYCHRVFQKVEPKIIHGIQLRAKELGIYIENYAALFASGAAFPEASTMLEATATANNTTAIDRAIASYKETMDRVAGPYCSNYLKPEELQEKHKFIKEEAVRVFRKLANFGSKKKINESKRNLMAKINNDYDMYEKLNQSRNPLAGFEIYILPLSIAFGAYLLRVISDWTCAPWSHICKRSSVILAEIYAVVFCFLAILVVTKGKQIMEIFKKIRKAFEVVAGDLGGAKTNNTNTTNTTKTKTE